MQIRMKKSAQQESNQRSPASGQATQTNRGACVLCLQCTRLPI